MAGEQRPPAHQARGVGLTADDVLVMEHEPTGSRVYLYACVAGYTSGLARAWTFDVPSIGVSGAGFLTAEDARLAAVNILERVRA